MSDPKPNNKAALSRTIESVLTEMANETADSEEFAKMTDQLVKLHALKTEESKPRVSSDVLATIGANLLGILMIVGHERTHIVTSKALGFVLKLR